MFQFSIIIPCYNIQNEVDGLLERIFDSTDAVDYEVILIDDCSTDSTYSLLTSRLEAIKNINVNVYRTESNGGPGVARNLGLEMAKGKYIIFVDSDDYFDMHSLQQISDRLDAEPEIDLLVFPHYMLKRKKRYTVASYPDAEVIQGKDVILGNLTPWAKVFRADIIKEHGVCFARRTTGEDIYFVVHYLIYARLIKKMDLYNYTYVIHNNSITHKKIYDKQNLREQTTFDLLEPIYHEFFPEIEVEMFVRNNLLTRAKQMCAASVSLREMKAWFRQENKRYPEWIKQVNGKNQGIYRRLAYKFMYENRPALLKLLMFARGMLH